MIRLLWDPGLSPGVVWLVSYLVHSTLWVAGVWLIVSRVRSLSGRARNLLWRLALVGPLLSTVLQVGAGERWALGSVAMVSAPAAIESTPAPLDLEVLVIPEDEPAFGAPPVIATEEPPATSWWTWVALAAAALSALRLGLLLRGLRRGIAGRRPVEDARVVHLFRRLRAALDRPVRARLSESDALASPIALLGGEICVPVRVRSLDDAALAAVLAHELAHVERRDNLWLVVAATIEAVLFFQPLNRLARRGLQESAELASDERAVELTDDPLGLARSLAEVAGWGLAGEGLMGSAVVSSRGALLRRVTFLLADRQGRARARWLGPALAAALAALVLAAPALAPAVVNDAAPRPIDARPVVAPLPSTAAPVQPMPAPAPAVSSAPTSPPASKPAVVGSKPGPGVPKLAPVGPKPAAPDAPSGWAAPAAPRAPAAPASPRAPRAPRAARGPRIEAPRLAYVRAPRLFEERGHSRAYVLVDRHGRAQNLGASSEELRQATALRAEIPGDYLWVRRRDQRLVITSPEAIQRLRPVLDQQVALRERELQLGVSHAEIGRKHADLSTKQAELATRQAEMGVRRAELGAKRAELSLRKVQLKLKSRGEVPARELDRRLHELRRSEEELQRKAEELARKQDELGQRQGELGRQQGELGRRQGDLGRQMGDLGRQAGEIARQKIGVDSMVRERVDRTIQEEESKGQLRRLDRGD